MPLVCRRGDFRTLIATANFFNVFPGHDGISLVFLRLELRSLGSRLIRGSQKPEH